MEFRKRRGRMMQEGTGIERRSQWPGNVNKNLTLPKTNQNQKQGKVP